MTFHTKGMKNENCVFSQHLYSGSSMIDEVMQCRVADCDGKVIIAKNEIDTFAQFSQDLLQKITLQKCGHRQTFPLTRAKFRLRLFFFFSQSLLQSNPFYFVFCGYF